MEIRTNELTCRELAILRAVAAGRVEVTCGCEPDLFIDGLTCCDQYTARVLIHHGLVVQARPSLVGDRVPARLTAAGYDVLGAVSGVA